MPEEKKFRSALMMAGGYIMLIIGAMLFLIGFAFWDKATNPRTFWTTELLVLLYYAAHFLGVIFGMGFILFCVGVIEQAIRRSAEEGES